MKIKKIQVSVGILEDVIQRKESNLEVPEIRVWCHSHNVGNLKGDYYYAFDTFQDAVDFCARTKTAENNPILAFRGYEINLYTIDDLIR